MALSGKHYESIAKVLRVNYVSSPLNSREREAVISITTELADLFADANIGFDADRFIAAANPDMGEQKPPRKSRISDADYATQMNLNS